MQLQDVADALGDSVNVVAIGTDEPDDAREFARGFGLRFPLLSDPNANVARALGITHPEPWGHGTVPFPTTLVLDADGRITWSRLGEDVADRPSEAELLEAVAAVRL